MAEGSDGIEMQGHRRLARAGRQSAGIVDRSDLVVRDEGGRQCRAGKLSRELPRIDRTVGCQPDVAERGAIGFAQPLRCVERRMVLAVRQDHRVGAGRAGPPKPLQREVDGLGSPGCEDDLDRIAVEHRREPLA